MTDTKSKSTEKKPASHKVRETAQKAKAAVKNTKEAYRSAWEEGYSAGFAARDKLTDIKGVNVAATSGYSKGLKDKKKVNKITKKAASIQKRCQQK